MEQEKRIEMIIDFAKKVLQYPRGSKGYDPVDEIRLQSAIEKYEQYLDNQTPQRLTNGKATSSTIKKGLRD